MTKRPLKKVFSLIFLSIFLVKMVISIAPVLANRFDSKVVNAVIMQLEIEHNCAKETDTSKNKLIEEFFSNHLTYNFHNRFFYLSLQSIDLYNDEHMQTFYPVIPTPPPNS